MKKTLSVPAWWRAYQDSFQPRQCPLCGGEITHREKRRLRRFRWQTSYHHPKKCPHCGREIKLKRKRWAFVIAIPFVAVNMISLAAHLSPTGWRLVMIASCIMVILWEELYSIPTAKIVEDQRG